MDIRSEVKKMKEDSPQMAALSIEVRNQALLAAAEALLNAREEIFKANEEDIEAARDAGIPQAVMKRLKFYQHKLEDVIQGIRELVKLKDPLAKVQMARELDQGLRLYRISCPIGVIGIIFEARPNVTSDAFGLCFKAGNCAILKGGSDAIHSNIAIVSAMQEALDEMNIPKGTLSLIEATDHETTNEFMKMKQYVDLLIPRGGSGLIQTVVNNATIPVIETGTGNCHVYVDEYADLDMAVDIIRNAKTQRIGVCNACESIVVHRAVAKEFLPKLYAALKEYDVQMRGDDAAVEYLGTEKPLVTKATEEDWGKEYLDYVISMKTVDSVDEAIAHINRYNTGHSEAIITESYTNSQKFLDEVDAACVYVNASTRFTDGFEFGFGAEIGISTQKLHARGPMGLLALTTTKYIIYGNGQVRP